MRPFCVTVVVRIWDGRRVGDGAFEDVECVITHPGDQNPKVRQLTPSDVVASGGSLQDARFEIGPVTPDYPGLAAPKLARAPFIAGGTSVETLDPETSSETSKEVLYVIKGPGLPADGMACKKVFQQTDRQFRYTITVDSLGVSL
jgi:hypothetical protein